MFHKRALVPGLAYDFTPLVNKKPRPSEYAPVSTPTDLFVPNDVFFDPGLSPLTSPRHFTPIPGLDLPDWAYSGFDQIDRIEDIGYFYRRWSEEPERIVSDEEQRTHVKSLILKYTNGSMKDVMGLNMIREVVASGENKWTESAVFLERYMRGRERGHYRIFHDPLVPVVKPYRPQLVDERRYICNPNTFDMSINRQFRVNPVHIEVFNEMQID